MFETPFLHLRIDFDPDYEHPALTNASLFRLNRTHGQGKEEIAALASVPTQAGRQAGKQAQEEGREFGGGGGKGGRAGRRHGGHGGYGGQCASGTRARATGGPEQRCQFSLWESRSIRRGRFPIATQHHHRENPPFPLPHPFCFITWFPPRVYPSRTQMLGEGAGEGAGAGRRKMQQKL
ncbi:hypothetical protein MARPO_0010s0160 [Marchantia polymorpha]|uniref:Uncharacterized protein n=1 Tax=Marchantia polymorpha TaxID=3197 RepID=A0A2R6XKZ3_MARPO|nr:hypothetical protein MARPO_0010s0160 [Marchantia polymorpha]|eukprot:PTQ46784.1 hypothetical protein MARPO_0010s0160 [Marchantia polymorpha]